MGTEPVDSTGKAIGIFRTFKLPASLCTVTDHDVSAGHCTGGTVPLHNREANIRSMTGQVTVVTRIYFSCLMTVPPSAAPAAGATGGCGGDCYGFDGRSGS
jgi:hypothetical protein